MRTEDAAKVTFVSQHQIRTIASINLCGQGYKFNTPIQPLILHKAAVTFSRGKETETPIRQLLSYNNSGLVIEGNVNCGKMKNTLLFAHYDCVLRLNSATKSQR